MNIISVIGCRRRRPRRTGLHRTAAQDGEGATLASADPVDGHTLEWTTASPPPSGNFAAAVGAVRTERPLLDTKEAQLMASTTAGAELSPAPLPRPRTLLVGTVFAIVACGMFFAGLVRPLPQSSAARY